MYLCYFRSSINDFWSCSIHLSLLSNATGLTQFEFFKRDLYPISHNALIMDCFSRAHLYSVPRVTVFSFFSKIDREKIKYCELSTNFYGIPIRYSERELWKIYQGHFFEMNFRSLQKPWLTQIISPKILHILIWNFYCSFLKISDFPHKNFIFRAFVEKNLEWKFHDDLFQMVESTSECGRDFRSLKKY